MRIVCQVLRLLLGGVFLSYAFAKFSGMQFSHTNLDGTLRELDSISLVWYFFGYSPVYGLFIAVGQLVAALLTIWNRTYRIGLLIYFSIALNIAVLDWCFHFPLPATLLATILALVSACLIFIERKYYRLLLHRSPKGSKRATQVPAASEHDSV